MNFLDLKNDLDTILAERNKKFPERNIENDLDTANFLDKFSEFIFLECKSFIPDKFAIEQEKSFVNYPVFLCGAMKSGTTLLSQLLDAHSELIVLPGDSYVIRRISKPDPPRNEQLQTAWNGWVKRMVNPTGQEPFWIFGSTMEPYIKFRQYLIYWYKTMPSSWRSIVLSVVLSYWCANPSRAKFPKKWIEKTPGNEFYTEKILTEFPRACFIHIVRDPRENMASLKKLYQTRNWAWNPFSIAATLSKSCQLSVENQKKIGKNRYYVLSYEELITNPHMQMLKIAEFINIKWNESLLWPTVNSLPAYANSMYKDRQAKGIIKKTDQNKWKKVLTESEQRLALSTLTGAKKAGYEWNITMKDWIRIYIDKYRESLKNIFKR